VTQANFSERVFCHTLCAMPPSALEHESDHSTDRLTWGSISSFDTNSLEPKSQLQRRAVQLADGRRMFRAKKEYLGLGPRYMEVGDIVVILLGGPTPYILRPVLGEARCYRFIGECYVEEFMNCGALQHIREELQKAGSRYSPPPVTIPITSGSTCSSPLRYFRIV
jgi:hypothetical protein